MKNQDILKFFEIILARDEEIIFDDNKYYFTNLGIYCFDENKIDFFPGSYVQGFSLSYGKKFLQSDYTISAIEIKLKDQSVITVNTEDLEEAAEIQNIIKELFLVN